MLFCSSTFGGTVSYQYDVFDRLVRMDQLDDTVIVYDGDGIQDGTEMGITTGVLDPDGAGRISGTDTLIFSA